MHPIVAMITLTLILLVPHAVLAELRAGAAAVDVTPQQLPVLVNGGILSRMEDKVAAPLYARAIVLSDGRTKLAIVVVDSCAMPRALLDRAKSLAAESTDIATSHMLISATHTHTAPSVVPALGTSADPAYSEYLPLRLADAIRRAADNLQPAQVGSAVANAAPYTALRRWIRRPDRMLVDPFGNLTVRANMHPGHQSLDATGESGPTDPDLSIIAFQSREGRPIALLANFSMHYFVTQSLSPDYFGLFADRVQKRLGPAGGNDSHPPFIAMMSHGPSGDIWRRDYSQPPVEKDHTMSSYADALVDIVCNAYPGIAYRHDVTLDMVQAEMTLKYRTPNNQRLEWARKIVTEMDGRIPTNTTEVYAREAILLHEMQETEILLQAVRIGHLGITAIPNEVYALTSLKLKALSPLQPTVNIELANGAEGYIPPPEQHWLGGYNTWDARSAGLEVQAEPKIVQAVLQLLEQVSGKPRRKTRVTLGSAAQAVLDTEPVAYYRMDEMAGPLAVDDVGPNHGIYEMGVAYYLDGPHSDHFNKPGEVNRCAHFAGGRLRVRLGELRHSYSVALWFWNGMPNDGRPVAGYLFSRGHDLAFGPPGDHLGIGGSAGHMGKLIFSGGDAGESAGGRSVIDRWTWNHVVMVRDGDSVRVYLNGKVEIDTHVNLPDSFEQIFLGGRSDNQSNFEGRIDEAAIFDRPLNPDEVAAMFRAAAM